MWNRNDVLLGFAIVFIAGAFLGEAFSVIDAGALWSDEAASWTQAVFSVAAIAAAALIPMRVYRKEREERERDRQAQRMFQSRMELDTCLQALVALSRMHEFMEDIILPTLEATYDEVEFNGVARFGGTPLSHIDVPDTLTSISRFSHNLPLEGAEHLHAMIGAVDQYNDISAEISQLDPAELNWGMLAGQIEIAEGHAGEIFHDCKSAIEAVSRRTADLREALQGEP